MPHLPFAKPEEIGVEPQRLKRAYALLEGWTTDGQVVVGQLAGGDKEQLYFSTNPLEPAQITRIRRDSIESRQASFVSSMPTGLLNTLTEGEILDLMAWVESGGKKP